MIRMWGLLKSQCLPVFCRFSDNCDVLATIYRLLTKLALNPNEPDDMLLDECCLLPNQVSIPNLPVVSQKAALVSAVLNHVPVFVSIDGWSLGWSEVFDDKFLLVFSSSSTIVSRTPISTARSRRTSATTRPPILWTPSDTCSWARSRILWGNACDVEHGLGQE